MRIIASIALLLAFQSPAAFADDQHLYVYATSINLEGSKLFRAPLQSPETVQSWDLGGWARGLGVSANGEFAYLKLYSSVNTARLMRWNIPRAEFDRDLGPIASSGEIHLFHGDSRLAYVESGELRVIDLATGNAHALALPPGRVDDESHAGPYVSILTIAGGARGIQIYDARDESLRTLDVHGLGGAIWGAHLLEVAHGDPQLWVFLMPSGTTAMRIARIDLESGEEIESLAWEPLGVNYFPPRLGLHPDLNRYCVAEGVLECRRLSDGVVEDVISGIGITGPAQMLGDQWVLIDSGVVPHCGFATCPPRPGRPLRMHSVNVATASTETALLDPAITSTAFFGNSFVAGQPPPAPIPSSSGLTKVLLGVILALMALLVLQRRRVILARC